MHLNTIIFLATAGLATAALPKANEYKSGDCSGSLNYGHHAFDLHMVTMDDSTNSVYQAGTYWYFFDGKTGNGGRCTGKFLGKVGSNTPACLNLNTASPGNRIRCMCNPNIGVSSAGNSCDYVS